MRFLSFVLFLSLAGAANAASGSTGDWKSPTGSVIRVYKCDADLCLKIVSLPPGAPESSDQLNPDASLRNRPLCGLVIGTGFHIKDTGHAEGGRLYDPKSGHTYKGTITADGDSLKLHGYVGISMLGRTETWQRVDAVAGCK